MARSKAAAIRKVPDSAERGGGAPALAAEPMATETAEFRFSLSLWLGGAYLLLLLVGAIVLRLPGATIAGNEMSVYRAVFTSINAGTLTGFQQSVALDEYGALGQWCVLALMTLGTLFTL